MTETAMIALIGIVPTTVIATATLITSLRNAKKADEKAEVIRAQTDGHLSKLTEQLKEANATIAGMNKTIERIAPTNR